MPTYAELETLNAKLFDEVKRLSTAPRLPARVLRVYPTGILLSSPNGLVLAQSPGFELVQGSAVLVHAESGAIVEKLDLDLPVGTTHVVLGVDKDKGVCTVDKQGQSTQVLDGDIPDLREGDKVLLDNYGMIVLERLAAQTTHNPERVTATQWDDISGQEEAKLALREAVELPRTHPELFTAYNKPPTKGVLLYGPPGCGKTMLGRALATSLDAGFVYVKGPELLNSYVGASEAAVRSLFATARKHQQTTGTPAVLFIDEADALLGVRGGRNSFMEKTIVPMFLTEMDGMEQSAAIVVLATNRPDQLDPAVVREGRIDRKIKITRPDLNATVDLFNLYLRKTRCADEIRHMAYAASTLLFSEAMPMYRVDTNDKTVLLHFHHMLSGALVANIVDQASSSALRRDMTNDGVASGVTNDDLVAAVHHAYRQSHDLHHDEVIADYVNPSHITNMEKVCATLP